MSSAGEVAECFSESFSGKTLILVSNREPYIHLKTKSGEKIREPIGGLTKALDPVMQAVGGTWVAWGSGNADRAHSDQHDCELVPPFDHRYTLRRVWMEHSEVRGAYHGFSNQVLWPLFHNMLEKVRLRRWFWNTYERINRRFAATVLSEIPEQEAVIWLQDYHLASCARAIRRKRPDAVLTQFWHIPWVSHEILQALPQSQELLEGLLANNMLAFHTPQFCINFLEACEVMLPCNVDYENGIVNHDAGICHVCPIPISIDAEDMASYAASDRSERFMKRFVEKFKLQGRAVAISVDRIDYTKGLLEKIDALDLFFAKHADWRGRLSLVMVSASSRDNIRAYSDLKRKLLRKIENINKRFGTEDWQPVIFTGALDKWSLIPLYRLSDMAIISSLKDGMNLVAKEYIACQIGGNGTLLLSEFAGAAEDMDAAVPINPYDTEGFADQILAALQMTDSERKDRMSRLRRRLHRHNIYHWMIEILRRLHTVVN